MSLNRITLLLGVVIVASVATWLVWHSDPGAQGEANEKMSGTLSAADTSASPVEITDASHTLLHGKSVKIDSSGSTGTALSMRQQFFAASDYKAFIVGNLKHAEAGDIDAQYYISVALNYCDKEFRALFRRRTGSGWLTLDEALSRAAGRREQSLDVVGDVDRKCRKLM